MDIFEESKEVAFTVAENCFVPALEEMTDGPVFSVEIHGIALVNALERFGERDVFCLDQKMDMVVHEHICVEAIMVALLVSGKNFQVFLAIRGRLENLLLLISSGDDMIKRAVVFYPWLSCHGERIAESMSRVNNSIFKSDPIPLKRISKTALSGHVLL